MKCADICCAVDLQAKDQVPTWDGDNREFIRAVLPFIPNLTHEHRQLLHWAYGLNPGTKSWEMESDGETLVKDKSIFLGLDIKNPAGVVHDFQNRVPGHRTPDGKVWTPREVNRVYRELQQVFGYSWIRAWHKWLWVSLTVWRWWRR